MHQYEAVSIIKALNIFQLSDETTYPLLLFSLDYPGLFVKNFNIRTVEFQKLWYIHFRLIEGRNDILKYEGLIIKNNVYDSTYSSLILCLTQIFQVSFVDLQFLSISTIYYLLSFSLPSSLPLFSFFKEMLQMKSFFLLDFLCYSTQMIDFITCVANHFNTVSYHF